MNTNTMHKKYKKNLSGFVENKRLPIYNWLYYKEGFSAQIVFDLIERFDLKKGQTILEPFCGSGTTLLAAKEKGINSVGFDVLDIAVFASAVKTRDYSKVIDELKGSLEDLKNVPKRKQKIRIKEKIILRAFPERILSELLNIKENVGKIKNRVVSDFFLLCLINTATKTSFAMKDGGCIKIDKSRSLPPAKYMFIKTAKKMIRDVEEIKFPGCTTEVHRQDARCFELKENSIDCVITSPPYLNKIEYTNVYFIEEYLFLKRQFNAPLRSFVGKNSSIGIDDIGDEKLKKHLSEFRGKKYEAQIASYFVDTKRWLENVYFCLKRNKYCAVIVGGGCFEWGVVESDVILGLIAKDVGFELIDIEPLKKIVCTKNRTTKIGVLNESLVVLKK